MSDFAPYKQALILYEELGFNESCYAVYSEYDQTRVYDKDSIREGKIIPAPLYQQAFRWFREKHKIECYIKSLYEQRENKGYYFGLDDYTNRDFYSKPYYSYKEAELACLLKLIEIVKQQKQ
jgi:hypothetical protein